MSFADSVANSSRSGGGHMSGNGVTFSVENGIARLVMSNPPLNILTRAVLGELREGFCEIESNPSVRVVVISAEGKHFSVGADVGEHLPPHYTDLITEFLDTISVVHGCPVPVVVAVTGRCLGAGFELAAAADIVVAGEGALFGQPEIVLGVFPPAACAMLPSVSDPGLAAELVFTGDPIDVQEAHRTGFVRRVVADQQVEEEALELAGRIARHSGAALRHAKRAFRPEHPGSMDDALRHAGRVYIDELMQTDDAIEGLRAFLEKREPAWRHQ